MKPASWSFSYQNLRTETTHQCKTSDFSVIITRNDHSFANSIISTDTFHNAILFITTSTTLDTTKLIFLIGKPYLVIIAGNVADFKGSAFTIHHFLNFERKRMYSSRMRTGRALTVSGGGGGWCIPEEFFGGKRN